MTPKPKYDPDSLERRGRGRAAQLSRRLGIEPGSLTGSRILEIGCGYGECTAAVITLYQADGIGIDPFPRWHKGPYTNLAETGCLLQIDATSPALLALDPFDYVQSYAVLEHIERPRVALENIYKVLKPDGRAYLYFNLYRGASASHLTAFIDLPWMHLILTEDEIRARMRTEHGLDRGPSWVNKLTHLHYLEYANAIGFRILKYWYERFELTDAFLEQYRTKLGPYPRDDLEKNFMHLVLERPDETRSELPVGQPAKVPATFRRVK
jgi:SAM-dependent methyltransferase